VNAFFILKTIYKFFLFFIIAGSLSPHVSAKNQEDKPEKLEEVNNQKNIMSILGRQLLEA